jgi:hypothetical protein
MSWGDVHAKESLHIVPPPRYTTPRLTPLTPSNSGNASGSRTELNKRTIAHLLDLFVQKDPVDPLLRSPTGQSVGRQDLNSFIRGCGMLLDIRYARERNACDNLTERAKKGQLASTKLIHPDIIGVWRLIHLLRVMQDYAAKHPLASVIAAAPPAGVASTVDLYLDYFARHPLVAMLLPGRDIIPAFSQDQPFVRYTPVFAAIFVRLLLVNMRPEDLNKVLWTYLDLRGVNLDEPTRQRLVMWGARTGAIIDW